MSKSFDDILDICIERIVSKGDSLERCLEDYPQHAAELEPLLRAAVSLSAASSGECRLEFRQAAKGRVLSALAAGRESPRKPARSFWTWQRRWSAAVIAVLAVVLVGAGTVAAASDSVPGDVLYPVKTGSEKVQAFFTFGDNAKANLHIRLAERRAEEIETLGARQREITPSVLSGLHAETERAIALVNLKAAPNKDLVERLEGLTARQRAILSRMIADAAQDVKSRLLEALRLAKMAHERVMVLKQKLSLPEALHVRPQAPAIDRIAPGLQWLSAGGVVGPKFIASR